MENDLLSKYGTRLTERQYEQSVSKLYRQAAESLPSALPQEIEETLKAKEFSLAIDHRLGVNFPIEKREALWSAKQRVEKQRIRLIGRFIKNSILKREFADGMEIVLDQMKKEFSKVLTDEELQAFMELEDGETPVGLIDPERL